MKKDFLFYAANFDPEVNRMNKSFENGEINKFNMFKKVTMQTLDCILSSDNITSGGQEEWGVVRNLVESFEIIDQKSKNIILKYGVPFPFRFAKNQVS